MTSTIRKPSLTAIPLNLIGLTSLAIGLLIFRFYWTNTLTYWSLTWNLFLAVLPLIISSTIFYKSKSFSSKYFVWPFVALWLLFFPNAPYILTDLFHLQTRGGMPKWFDLLMVLSFAWTGLIFGILSLMQVQEVITRFYGQLTGWITSISSIILGSFGIYLGRYLRWNSWDVVTSPKPLLKDIYYMAIDPFAHPRTVGMTLTFSAFLILVYLTFKSLRSQRTFLV